MSRHLGGSDRINFQERNRNEIPRGLLFLHNEIRRDNRPRLWFLLAGSTGTGKSTLATQFTLLDGNELRPDEVVARNSYRFTINLNTRPQINQTGLAHVGIHIEPLPYPPGIAEILQIASLRAAIFLFDLNQNDTLNAARSMLEVYEENGIENMHPFILVGNKIDIRDNPRNNSSDPFSQTVSTLYGASIARSIGALGYYECSALRNIGIGPVLDKILQLILR